MPRDCLLKNGHSGKFDIMCILPLTHKNEVLISATIPQAQEPFQKNLGRRCRPFLTFQMSGTRKFCLVSLLRPSCCTLADTLCWARIHRPRVFGGGKNTTELEDSAQLHSDHYTPLDFGGQAGRWGGIQLPPGGDSHS